MKLGGCVHEWCCWICSTTYLWKFKDLSSIEIVCLFRDNCFELSVGDSHDYCRHCMWIRWIETNPLTIIIEYDYEWHTLYMYNIWEEKWDILHVLRRRKGMNSIELSWPVCPEWILYKWPISIGLLNNNQKY